MFFSQYKKISITVFVLLLIFAYLSPLLPYLAKTLSLTRDIIVAAEPLKSDNGRTNILILGLDGSKNEPSARTDTMLFTSFDEKNKNALMVSIPRDIWIPEMQAKINTAYHYGNQQEGLGMEWSRRYISQITGQPIHYVVVISFEGFVKIVDMLGGLDVQVEHSFKDTEYPIPGRENDLCNGDPKTRCRYETIEFSSGQVHMDGETALKFARSRHAEGDEGSDFARSQRQQKIILAVREKVFSTDILLNPKKLSQILEEIESSIETDIPESQTGSFARLSLAAKDAQINSQILGHIYNPAKKQEGFLINPPISDQYQRQYVLVPRGETWKSAQEWISCLLSNSNCPIEEYSKDLN